MLLDDALKKFADVFNDFEGNFGVIQFRAPVQLMEPLPLGSALREYYSRLLLDNNPSIGKKMHLILFTLDKLVGAQSGWRWGVDRTGKQVEDANWKSSWIVFADRNGDAVFVDTETINGSVYGSIQKRNFLIAENLGDFFFTIAECMLVEKDKFGYEVMDDDFNVLDSFLDLTRGIARKNLGEDGCNGFMKFFFE
jgi:hypothetical protein